MIRLPVLENLSNFQLFLLRRSLAEHKRINAAMTYNIDARLLCDDLSQTVTECPVEINFSLMEVICRRGAMC